MSGESAEVNDEVELQDGRVGTVMYKGPVSGANGVWLGIQFEEAVGNSNGTVMGQTYFNAQSKHGSFVKQRIVTRILHRPSAAVQGYSVDTTDHLSCTFGIGCLMVERDLPPILLF